MGKGDKKSRRGKIILGSYGVRRRKNNKKIKVVEPSPIAKVKAVVKPEATKIKEVKAEIGSEIQKVKEAKAETKPEKAKAETKKIEADTLAGPKPKAKKTTEPTKKTVEE